MSKAEEEVEVVRLTDGGRGERLRVVVYHRIDGGVEIVGKVEADGTGGGVIAEARADGVGEVVEAAVSDEPGRVRRRGEIFEVLACIAVGLMEAEEAVSYTHLDVYKRQATERA